MRKQLLVKSLVLKYSDTQNWIRGYQKDRLSGVHVLKNQMRKRILGMLNDIQKYLLNKGFSITYMTCIKEDTDSLPNVQCSFFSFRSLNSQNIFRQDKKIRACQDSKYCTTEAKYDWCWFKLYHDIIKANFGQLNKTGKGGLEYYTY